MVFLVVYLNNDYDNIIPLFFISLLQEIPNVEPMGRLFTYVNRYLQLFC